MWKIPDEPAFIGNRGDFRDNAVLRRAAIQAIVDLAMEELPVTASRETLMFRIPLEDGGGNEAETLRLGVDLVHTLLVMGRTTLIVCSAGMSRSPSIVALAIARKRNIEPEAALSILAAHGPVDVSPAFWAGLRRAHDARNGRAS